MMRRAYIGVGANLGDRRDTIERAVALVADAPRVCVIRVSALRETDPVGYVDQPAFLNGAFAVDTTLEPRALLQLLLATETALGRERTGPRFGPRTVDLDLLVYDALVIDEPGLQLPHPRLHERIFALEPLAELAPGLVVPGRGTVLELLRRARGVDSDEP